MDGPPAEVVTRHERVVRSARDLLLRNGYAAVTPAAVAAAAGLPVGAVTDAFGSAAALVRAVWEDAAGGRDGEGMRAARRDPVGTSEERVVGWVRADLEEVRRTEPVLARVREAADPAVAGQHAADDGAADLLAGIERARATRMLGRAEALERRGDLHDDLDVERARDLLLAVTGDLRDALVLRADWSDEEYASVWGRALAAALLAPEVRHDHGEGTTGASVIATPGAVVGGPAVDVRPAGLGLGGRPPVLGERPPVLGVPTRSGAPGGWRRAEGGGPSSVTWSSAAFTDEATAWVDHALGRAGATRTGQPERTRVRPWSMQLRVPTDVGPVWFKACAPALRHEAALTTVLAEVAPDAVPSVVAADAARGWLLLRDGGRPLRENVSREALPTVWADVLRRYARLQRDAVGLVPDLLLAGVPDRGPRSLVTAWSGWLRAGVPGSERGGEAAAAVHRAAAFLEDGPVPLTVQHDDLHPGNVLWSPDGGEVVLDWGDAHVGHPFASLLVALRSLGRELPEGVTPPVRARLLRAYLEPWGELGDRAELAALVAPALLVARIGRVAGWEAALASASEAEHEEWDGRPASWLREVTDVVRSGAALTDPWRESFRAAARWQGPA